MTHPTPNDLLAKNDEALQETFQDALARAACHVKSNKIDDELYALQTVANRVRREQATALRALEADKDRCGNGAGCCHMAATIDTLDAQLYSAHEVISKMAEALEATRYKLAIYRKYMDGEYHGGMEYSALRGLGEDVLALAEPFRKKEG